MTGKPIDTDGNFRFSMATDFVQELVAQAKIGIPTIYQVELLFQHRNFSKSVVRRLTEEDYSRIRETLAEYADKLEQDL